MDNKDSKLSSAIDAVRQHRKDKEGSPSGPQSRPRNTARFRGELVNRNETQIELNSMDQDERIHHMQEDLEFVFTDRIHDMIQESESEDQKQDARSLCLEWGSVIGLEDKIEGDNPNKYLLWTTEQHLKYIHKKKSNIEKLFDD